MSAQGSYAPRKGFLLISSVIMVVLICIMLIGENIVLSERNRFAKHRIPIVSVHKLQKVITSKSKSFPGRIASAKTVNIQPMVTGIVMSSHFSEGQVVHKDDLLFTIDPRLFKAAVSSAKGKLKAVRSSLHLTQNELERFEVLLGNQQVSQNEYESIKGRYELLQGEVAAAEAALEQAELELDFTQVRAPFTGRVGKVLVDPGNVVTKGASAQILTTLVSVDSFFVEFDIDEQTYMEIMSRPENITSPPQFIISPYQSTQDERPLAGTVVSFDNQIDPNTGSMSVRGRLHQSPIYIAPGMYFRVTVSVPFTEPQLIVPHSAVLTDHMSNYVYVLGGGNTALKRHVTLGESTQQGRVLINGLGAGDAVIINGVSHIKAGEKVNPRFNDSLHLSKLDPS